MGQYVCSACINGSMRRSPRNTLKERFLYSLMGYYPWRCRRCKHREMLRDRGPRVRRDNSEEASIDPESKESSM